jgi:hypothetical protein
VVVGEDPDLVVLGGVERDDRAAAHLAAAGLIGSTERPRTTESSTLNGLDLAHGGLRIRWL